MTTLTYTTDIKASKQKVWNTMLQDDTYRQWTAAFHEGSYYEGSWDQDGEIRFLAEEDGKLSGLAGRIAENRQYEYISIEYTGIVEDGQLDTTSREAQRWIGAHENYSFSETDGVTTLIVDMISTEAIDDKEMRQMFDQMWLVTLAKLKEMSEAA